MKQTQKKNESLNKRLLERSTSLFYLASKKKNLNYTQNT